MEASCRKVDESVVTLVNLEGNLRHDQEYRQKTAERLIKTYGLKSVEYDEAKKNKNDYIKPLYNIDVN